VSDGDHESPVFDWATWDSKAMVKSTREIEKRRWCITKDLAENPGAAAESPQTRAAQSTSRRFPVSASHAIGPAISARDASGYRQRSTEQRQAKSDWEQASGSAWSRASSRAHSERPRPGISQSASSRLFSLVVVAHEARRPCRSKHRSIYRQPLFPPSESVHLLTARLSLFPCQARKCDPLAATVRTDGK